MENLLPTIFQYAVFSGFEFAAFLMMTRGGRPWFWRGGALPVMVALDVALESFWQIGEMPLQNWLAICFLANWFGVGALVFALSRDSLGRRTFLSLIYGAYAIGFAAIFHLIAYRNVFGLGELAAGCAGLAAVIALNALLLLWVLPSMPPDGRGCRWRVPCVAAALVAGSMFATGVWPISVLTAPARYCSAFALASAVAWVVFPLLCRAMRIHLRNVDVEHHLAELTSEMKVRRAAIDAARRLRHDQRHHRVQLAEYLLRGACDQALAYLRALDDEAEETPMDRMVWCPNETINAILSACARKAAVKGVAFRAEVHVECPVDLPDVELVALLANLVENAVEAGGGEVTVVLRSRAHGIGITVSNPVPDGFALAANGLPTASPGIGLESVRRVVERHHAQWEYALSEGILTCRVILMFANDGRHP